MSYYLGIDFGTSAVRGIIIDSNDRIVSEQREALPAASGQSPHVKQAPGQWLDALQNLLRNPVIKNHVRHVKAISVDGTSGTVLLCNTAGQPHGDALMYHDASSHAAVARLKSVYGQPHCALSMTAGLPKILQLADHTTSRLTALHQADWMTGWLCGEYRHSDENNALKSGYNPAERAWPLWVREAVPSHIQLPAVSPPGTAIGQASPALQKLGFQADTLIRTGTTDSTASFLASGVRHMNQGVTTLGSTLVIKQLSATPIEDLARGIYSHRLGNTWLVGGASSSGGAVLSHYFTPQQLQTLSQQINPASSSDLDYYPLLAPGERFPVCDPKLAPRLLPRPDNDATFLHGMLQGMAVIEKHGYAELQRLGAPALQQVITSGGGSVNPVWRTIRQQTLGVPVSRAEQHEAAYGAALLAHHGTALLEKFTQAPSA